MLRRIKDGMSPNIAVGIAPSWFSERSNSTRFVKSLKAWSSIVEMEHWDRKIRCKFTIFLLTNSSFLSTWSLFPVKSKTWVAESRLSGTSSRFLLMHSTVCLPFFHLHVQNFGQSGLLEIWLKRVAMITRMNWIWRGSMMYSNWTSARNIWKKNWILYLIETTELFAYIYDI